MGIESLDQDALRLILSHLNPADAHRVSWTSRSLRIPAQEQVLKDVTLSSSFHQVVAFCEYILNDAPDLLRLMRALRVQNFMKSPDQRTRMMPEHDHSEHDLRRGAALVADLLQQVPALHTFSLHYAEVWMHWEPRIVTAIFAMQHFKELEFTDIGPGVSDTLRTLQSNPTKLSLADVRGLQSVPHMWRMDPTGISLPSVRILSAKVRYHLPGAPDLARIFPNAREVYFGDGSTPQFLVPSLGQLQGERVPVVDWPSLEVVRGTGTGLKYWKNAHPVHYLELLRPLGKNDGSTFEMAGSGGPNAAWEREDALTAVRNVQPVVLLVTLSARLGHRYLRSLFTASRRLRYVSAGVWEVRRYQTWLTDLVPWLSTFEEALQRLQGREIVCITIRFSILPESGPVDSDPADAPKSYAAARELVVYLLREWAGGIPSLRYLSLEVRPTSNSFRAGASTLGTATLLASSQAHGTASASNKLPGLAAGECESFWWKFGQDGAARDGAPIPIAQGERIARFLCSPRYHWEENLDTQLDEDLSVRDSPSSISFRVSHLSR